MHHPSAGISQFGPANNENTTQANHSSSQASEAVKLTESKEWKQLSTLINKNSNPGAIAAAAAAFLQAAQAAATATPIPTAPRETRRKNNTTPPTNPRATSPPQDATPQGLQTTENNHGTQHVPENNNAAFGASQIRQIIREELQGLTTITRNEVPRPPKTWANIAKNPGTTAVDLGHSPKNQQQRPAVTIPLRTLRQITIRGGNIAQEYANRSPEDTVQAVNRLGGKGGYIITNKFQNGDYRLTFHE
jgi:hypothetical protein